MLAELKNQNITLLTIKEPKTIKKEKDITIKQKTVSLNNNVFPVVKYYHGVILTLTKT